MGGAHSPLAIRIPYFFDLHGPSVIIDTACSSGLAVIELGTWTLKTFERWLKDIGYTPDTAQLEDRDFRLIYAMEWFRSTKGKLLTSYYEVVSTCLAPATFHQLETSWVDAEF